MVPAPKRIAEPWPPNKNNHLIDSGKYSLDVSLGADGIDASFWRIDLNYFPAGATSAQDFLRQVEIDDVYEIKMIGSPPVPKNIKHTIF